MVQRGVLLSAEREVIELYDVLNDFFSDADLEAGSSLQSRQHSHSTKDGAAVASSGAVHSNGRLATIEDMERQMIMQALEESDNNQQRAAERLGISARTIRNKLKKYRDEGLIN
jgi:DNA-binding NtrC family response regulator